MANRLTRRIRTAVLVVGALGATVVALPTVAGAQPQTHHKPQTIDEVQKELGALALKNSQLVEQYNSARIDVSKRRAAATTAQQYAGKVAHELTVARQRLGDSFAEMYESGSFSTTGALLTSDNGTSYLDQLDTMSMISQHNANMVEEVRAVKKRATAARDHANSLLSDARTKLAALGQQKDDVQTQVDKYKELLQTLTAAQQAAYIRSTDPEASAQKVNTATQKLVATKGTPAAARKAVQFALAQVGKPYVWGAAGPSSYDCSGLTMQAYASAGISLPHSAINQYNYGTHVTYDQLQPGDLIFLYQPISHVEIYIGDGLAVSAPTEGENVKVISVGPGGDYTGATRLVG